MTYESDILASNFLSIAHQFKLGALTTESRHPLTMELSEYAKHNIPEAISRLKKIELDLIDKVQEKMPAILLLRKAIESTIASGNKVYIYGCGATGRLALSLEFLWRYTKTEQRDSVIGFMSGGDLALIHSIESFEDHPEWGARQVREIGFRNGDFLIAVTEGGETPSVIGAVEEASRISTNSSWFLYCNPDSELRSVERSRNILDKQNIHKINLCVGPMSLSGSTRLQATTALMLAVGTALFPDNSIAKHKQWLSENDLDFLAKFAAAESTAYQRGDLLLYRTNHYGITIMTDTTERAPTFSLPGFENSKSKEAIPSLCYLILEETHSAREAWEKLLLRKPRVLEWTELDSIAGMERLEGFDFSVHAEQRRKAFNRTQYNFSIDRFDQKLNWRLQENFVSLDVKTLHPLTEHLILKFLLNTHSTIVMGRLDRFESNVMTWVKPSNNKLIDRAIRYVEFLLTQRNQPQKSYEEITRALFAEMTNLKAGEAIVLKTLDRLTK